MSPFVLQQRHFGLAAALLALVCTSATSPPLAKAEGGKPKVLLLPIGNLPPRLERQVFGTLQLRADMLSTKSYEAQAKKAATNPDSRFALKEIATQQGADVIVVAGLRGKRIMRVTYRDGSDARRYKRVDFRIRSFRLSPRARDKILQDLVRAHRAIARAAKRDARRRAEREARRQKQKADMAFSEDEAIDDEDEDEVLADESTDEVSDEEIGNPFSMAVGAGLGFGSRSITVPSVGGGTRLSTNLFPAANVSLYAEYLTSGKRRFALGFRGDYFTSIALKSREQRDDGTTRTVGSSSQSFNSGAYFRFRFSSKDRAPMMETLLGYSLRAFSAEQPLTVPGSTLTGPFARVSLVFQIGASALSLRVSPEVGAVFMNDAELAAAGVSDFGYNVGGQLELRYEVRQWLDLSLNYRESHIFVNTNLEDQFRDIERFGILNVAYVL